MSTNQIAKSNYYRGRATPNQIAKSNYYKGKKTMPCQCCGESLRSRDMTVHHVVPQHHIRTLGNVLPDIMPEQKLVFLCRPCHDRVEDFYKTKGRSNIMNELKDFANKDDISPALGNIYAFILNGYHLLYKRFLQSYQQRVKFNTL